MAAVTACQSQSEPMYPVVLFDALGVKIGNDAIVSTNAVYLELAVLQCVSR